MYQRLQEKDLVKRHPEILKNKDPEKPTGPLHFLYKIINFVFNTAIVLIETDGFYRHRFMDLYYAVAWTHDQNRKALGDDYLEKYNKQRTEQIEGVEK
jgi:hypothetical protein